MLGWGNNFPDGHVPEEYIRLQMVRFYQGGVTYDELGDGNLFEKAHTFMLAQNDVDEIRRQRAEAKARQ